MRPAASFRPHRPAAALLSIAAGIAATVVAAAEPLGDRTLVAWVVNADAEQRNVAPFTIQDGPSVFDALVYAEIRPRVWMAGSDYFHRTLRDQSREPEDGETGVLHRHAIVTRGREVELWRDDTLVSRHAIPGEAHAFPAGGAVLFGVHHLDMLAAPRFRGEIEDARIYDRALGADEIRSLRPDAAGGPPPFAWWRFDDGVVDSTGRYPEGIVHGRAAVEGGRLRLRGGFAATGLGAGTPSRETERWPRWHVSALPDEGLCRPYDANGCIFWKGRYHLMYIFQDPELPHGGHCWGHASSADLVDWTFHPPALVPAAGDPDRGIFSGNAFLDRDGRPTLCWFGIDAGVCVATAEDDGLLRWRKSPHNPVIPIPKPGDPGHGAWHVWDPFLWWDGDEYRCLLGGNRLPDGEDTLWQMRSADLVRFEPVGPFYAADPRFTVRGEDCSCPDFFPLGDRHVLMSISHNVGGRAYVGRLEGERFVPERHVRMNWPGGAYFAPESLLDAKGRRVVWAWITDPRSMTTQALTGSGVQSLPRILGLAPDGGLTIEPAPEIERLRERSLEHAPATLEDGRELVLDGIEGDSIEIELVVEPDGGTDLPPVLTGGTRQIVVDVLATPDGRERTRLVHDVVAGTLSIDASASTLRGDVDYQFHPLDSGGVFGDRRPGQPHRCPVTVAPLELAPGEPLRLRVFIDGPVLEVFANGRQCVTQQVFPSLPESRRVSVTSQGGTSRLLRATGHVMRPARYEDRRR